MTYLLARLTSTSDLDAVMATIEGYKPRERRHFLWRWPTPRLSRYLYKYQSFNHAHSITNLRDVLVGSVLRLSSPSDFNDPFDIAANFVVRATPTERWNRFEKLVRKQYPHRGWRSQKAAIDHLMSESDETLIAACKTLFEERRANAGVYCFAGSGKSTLMWSHYAANHTGVCLQFERSKDFGIFSRALPVRYQEELPTVNWITADEEGIGEVLYAKHPAWQYERENRLLAVGQAKLYVPFQPQALRSIIFGCRTNAADIARMNELLLERHAAGHPSIAQYSTSLHTTKYLLVRRKMYS